MSVAYGSTSITSLVDIESSRWYYKLATSKPSKPTVKADPPSGWSKTEPTYTEGSTNNLYVVNLIIYGDGTFEYSDVSLSSSYEAAKAAYNKATATQDNLDNLEIGGRNLYAVCNQTNGYINSSGGTIHAMNATYKCRTSDYIPVSEGEHYIFQAWVPSILSNQQAWIGYNFYSDNTGTNVGNRIAKYGIAGEAYLAYTNIVVPANATYIRVSYRQYEDGYCKLEKGNKATDWTPAPEDVSTYTDTAINNLEIGGTNLLRNTKTFIDWNKSNNISISTDSEGYAVADYSSVTTPAWNSIYNAKDTTILNYSVIRNKTVTLSFWVKIDDISVGIYNAMNVVFSLCTADSTSRMKYSNNVVLDKVANTTEWQKVVATVDVTDSYFPNGSGTINPDTDRMYIMFYNHSTSASHLKKVKLEFGNKATDWSFAPDDTEAAISELQPELIVGTHGTTATPTWTGTSTKITSLSSGTRIQFKLTSAGTSAGDTLNLTLADGTTTGAKHIYFIGTTPLKTQYGANAIIDLIYDGTAWRVLNPYTDTNTNTVGVYGGIVKVGANGVKNYSLIMKDTDTTWVSLTTTAGTGTSKARYTGGLYPDKVMYMGSNSAYAENANTGTCYEALAINLNYSTNSGSSLTIGNPVYLVGEIHTDGLFYLDATWWTQTQPTSVDGKTYIYLGLAYSTSNIYLVSDNTMMRFYDGEFLSEKEIGIREAQSTADSAQTTANTANNKASAKYGTCSTAAGTAAKVVACSNFTLFAGAEITIKFSTANTAAAPTLNVNSTGAKNIDIASAHASSSNQFLWAANAEITFTYTGSVWIPVGHPCTYYGACTIAAGTAAKTAAINQVVICKGTVVNIQMTNANTATTPSLNITSTGAKNIYAGGATIAANSLYNWTAGSTVQFTFDGQYWRMGESSALSKANNAMTAANGKNKVYHCAYADRPTSGLTANDILFDTADGYKMYRYNGSSWAAEQFGTGAIATGAIKANQIDANAVTTAKLDTGAVTADKITADSAFANKIFAQDITATGTITGATLSGAMLTGENIDIQAQDAELYMGLIGNATKFEIYASAGYDAYEDCFDCQIYMTPDGQLKLSSTELDFVNDTIDSSEILITPTHISVSSGLEEKTTYTSFSGNVVSDSTVVVVKKLGWCQVFGALKPTSAGTSFVTILDNTKVPAPQHGMAIYEDSMYWASSYTQPLRIRINASGGLDICRGYVGGSYGFSITYPIE